MKIRKFFVSALLPAAAMLAMTLSSCTKENSGENDTIGTPSSETSGPSDNDGPGPEDKPSKYSPEDLITVTFTADAEGTKTALGADGSGSGGSGRAVTWVEGDKVMFVWGPDEEDRCEGIAEDVSDDGKRATFTVSRVYEGAKAIYAVYPSGAFSSFTEGAGYDTDGEGTVRVSVGAMADGTRLDGSFGNADVCIARTSLASHKMKFKHLVAFVTMTATHPAASAVQLDGGSVAIGGILPVTAGVDADGYTTNVVRSAAESTSPSVTVTSSGLDSPTYVPVLAGLSFSDGVTLSYLNSDGATVGSATLRSATTVSLGSVLTFPSTLNTAFSKDWYVKADADGTGDGTSWDSPWDLGQMQSYLNTNNHIESTGHSEEKLASDAPVNIHIAAGTYSPTTFIYVKPLYTSTDLDVFRPVCLIGGYPSGITDATAASVTRDPALNETIFSGSSITDATNYGILYIGESGIASVSGITFSGYSSQATSRSAVRLVQSNSKSLKCSLYNCTIKNNVNARVGGGVTMTAAQAGCAEYLLQDCTFSGNSGGAGGGLNTGQRINAVIKNCTFNGNYTTRYSYNQDGGGAVKIGGGTLTFDGCTFNANYTGNDFVNDGQNVGCGGAVWITDESSLQEAVRFLDCSFTNNISKSPVGKGGAVFVQHHENVSFSGCTFSGNYCSSNDSATNFGGALCAGCRKDGQQSFAAGNVAIALTDCTFDGNYIAANTTDAPEATVAAGALYCYEPSGYTTAVTISGGEIKNHDDNADLCGGAIYLESGTLSIGGGAKFSSNAALKGGAICQAGGTLTIDTGTASFTSNQAGDMGGGIHSVAGSLAIGTGASFCGNSAVNYGGALSILGGGSISGSFSENTGTPYGSAVYLLCSGETTNFSNSQFSLNEATTRGAALYVPQGHSGNVSFTSCTFTQNYSSNLGGAVCLNADDGSTCTFSGCEFTGNESGTAGGAIADLKNMDLAIEDNCLFSSNMCTDNYGGAIYVRGEDESTNAISISDATFSGNYGKTTNNTGCYGGAAIYVGNGSSVCGTSLSISNSSFSENYSYNQGGAIQARTTGSVTVSDCAFTGNYTTNGTANLGSGGACYFINNTTTRGTVSFSRCTFSGNHTGYGNGTGMARGGAIAIGQSMAANYLDVRVDKCSFIGNSATQGGALLVHDNQESSVWLNDCLFDGNYAAWHYGTTVCCFYAGSFCLNNCSFHDSWCTNNRPVTALQWLQITDTDFIMSNCTLIGQPQYSSGDNQTYSSGCSLMRLEATAAGHSYQFINNIFCSPGSWCSSVLKAGSSSDYTLNLYSNKMSPLSGLTVSDSDAFNAADYYGTASYFGGLGWTTDAAAPRYSNSGWAWNGSLATGSVTTMNTLADVKTKIEAADSDFYDWLSSGTIAGTAVNGLSADQRGQARSTRTWPGAWQDSGSELPSGVTDIAAVNSRAAGLASYETANCYVINAAGKYAFPADIRGNGVPAGGLTAGISGIASAAEVWDDNDIVKSVSLHTAASGQPYIVVETPASFARGNALVAVKNGSGDILWSWHIWATSYRPGADDRTIGDGTNGCWNFMPLELGMTSPSDASCTLYQWGRKDPFRYKAPESTTATQLTLAESVRQPELFYSVYNQMYASDGDVSFWNPGNATSTTVKTMLDPCPPGYYVMPYDASKLILSKGIASCTASTQVSLKSGIDMKFHGIVFTNGTFNTGYHFYYEHSYWNEGVVAAGKYGSSLINKNGTSTTLDNVGGLSFGFPVRAVRDGRFRAGFMGDSITWIWGGGYENNDSKPEEQKGDSPFFVSNAFLNKGISGNTTAQMLARFDTDIVASHPEKVVILAGTNDLAGNDNGGVSRSSDYIVGNLAAMVQKALAGGASEVLLCSVLPVSQYSWRPAIVPMPLIQELNAKIRAYCEATAGCTYVDYYSSWLNEEGTGAKDGLTYDNVHPTRTGCALLESIISPYLE